jgi:hypothetical protein
MEEDLESLEEKVTIVILLRRSLGIKLGVDPKIPLKQFEHLDIQWRKSMLDMFQKDLGTKYKEEMINDNILLLDGILSLYSTMHLHTENDFVIVKSFEQENMVKFLAMLNKDI